MNLRKTKGRLSLPGGIGRELPVDRDGVTGNSSMDSSPKSRGSLLSLGLGSADSVSQRLLCALGVLRAAIALWTGQCGTSTTSAQLMDSCSPWTRSMHTSGMVNDGVSPGRSVDVPSRPRIPQNRRGRCPASTAASWEGENQVRLPDPQAKEAFFH